MLQLKNFKVLTIHYLFFFLALIAFSLWMSLRSSNKPCLALKNSSLEIWAKLDSIHSSSSSSYLEYLKTKINIRKKWNQPETLDFSFFNYSDLLVFVISKYTWDLFRNIYLLFIFSVINKVIHFGIILFIRLNTTLNKK